MLKLNFERSLKVYQSEFIILCSLSMHIIYTCHVFNLKRCHRSYVYMLFENGIYLNDYLLSLILKFLCVALLWKNVIMFRNDVLKMTRHVFTLNSCRVLFYGGLEHSHK